MCRHKWKSFCVYIDWKGSGKQLGVKTSVCTVADFHFGCTCMHYKIECFNLLYGEGRSCEQNMALETSPILLLIFTIVSILHSILKCSKGTCMIELSSTLLHKCYTVRGLPEQQILNQFQQPAAPLLQHQLPFSDGQRQQLQQQHQSQQHTSFSNPAPPLRMMSAAGKNHNSKGN